MGVCVRNSCSKLPAPLALKAQAHLAFPFLLPLSGRCCSSPVRGPGRGHGQGCGQAQVQGEARWPLSPPWAGSAPGHLMGHWMGTSLLPIPGPDTQSLGPEDVTPLELPDSCGLMQGTHGTGRCLARFVPGWDITHWSALGN